MSKVRAKDLALVAVAGGLLAFELVSLGEALPSAARAFASRGLPKAASVAPVEAAGAAAVPTAEVVVPEAAGQVADHEAARVASDAATAGASHAASCEASHAEVRAARSAAGRPACKARRVAYASSGARCIVLTRDRGARGARKAHAAVRVFSWSAGQSRNAHQLASSRRELRELKKLIDVSPTQPTL
jgi:hypothetical protein